MAETASNMLTLGTQAPDFSLPDVISGKVVTLDELVSPTATVIMFICNHCPYVKHIQKKLVAVVNTYQARNMSFIAISSNDAVAYPADNPENMQREANQNGYTFPYLFDESQTVAKAYKAACTPDFYIFNGNKACVYRGRFDSATPGNQEPVTGKDLCEALDNILAGMPISSDQKPSLGCNIKWKK